MENAENNLLSTIVVLLGVIFFIIVGWVCFFKLVLLKFRFVRAIAGMDQLEKEEEEKAPKRTRPRRNVRRD